MARRILIAPDKFKGSLSAPDAAAAIGEGIRRVEPDATLDLRPIADGGEGFMEALSQVMPSRWIKCPATDAYGRPIDSRYLLAETDEGPVAILEMSETAGLWRVSPEDRRPLNASTYGTGEQMRHAIETHGVTRIILGLGGSATNDGGMGMAMALGIGLLDEDGKALQPTPDSVARIGRIDFSTRIELPEIIAACDVDNPLLGPNGATAVFSTQKGSTEESRPQLEAALTRLVELSDGHAHALQPGAGAAGGLGFGLLHFADASLVSGFDIVADLLDLETHVRAADLVITGEGSIDEQSLSGKGPVALARMARAAGKPVIGVCGLADDAARECGLFDRLHALADTGLPVEKLIAEAAPLLSDLIARTLETDS